MTREVGCTTYRSALPWYVAGTLSTTEQESIRLHLEHCANCQRELVQWQAIAETTREEARHIEVVQPFAESWKGLQKRIAVSEAGESTASDRRGQEVRFRRGIITEPVVATMRRKRSRTTGRERNVPSPPRPTRRLPLKMSIVAVLFLAVAVVASSAYAAIVPMLTHLLNLESGTKKVLQANLYQDIHQSQTIKGFTLTLEKAYADANRAIIGYTIKSPPDHQYEPKLIKTVLSTEQGTILPPLETSGVFERDLGAKASSFDAASIMGNPKNLHLYLKIGEIYVDELDVSHKDGTNNSFTLQGPLTFNFSVPFHPGITVVPRLSLTADEKTLLLERVVVTLSEARAYVRGIAIHEKRFFTAHLQNASQHYRATEFSPDTDGALLLSFPYSLSNVHGTWTLTIQQDLRLIKLSKIPIKGGPWVFHFIVP